MKYENSNNYSVAMNKSLTISSMINLLLVQVFFSNNDIFVYFFPCLVLFLSNHMIGFYIVSFRFFFF